MSDEINEIYNTKYKIFQNSEYFKYSIDSIVLCDFIDVNYSDKVLLDLCTGNAPIPIIMSSKISKVYGIEIQRVIFNLALKSIEYNRISNVQIINDDVKNFNKYFEENTVDIITCNPPYFKVTSESILNKNSVKSIARHELCINIDEIIKISYTLLKDKGRLFLVYTSTRIAELIKKLNDSNFGVKKIQICYDTYDSDSRIFLIEAMKNGKNDVKIKNPCLLKKYRKE